MQPHALVVSQSDLHDEAWMSHSDEYARVLATMLDADLVQLSCRDSVVARVLRDRYRLRNVASGLPWTRTFEIAPPRQTYDVAVVVVNNLHQLRRMAAVPQWRSIADLRIAIVTELWPPAIEVSRPTLDEIGHDVDHVFVAVDGVVSDLERTSGVAVSFLPPAADAFAAPVVRPRARPFDVVNLGRRDPAQHAVLRSWAHERGTSYHAPETPAPRVGDHAAHRREYLTRVGSGRFHVANVARFDDPDVAQGHREYGYRYFEALATGAVVVGDHPPIGMQRRVFGDDVPFLHLPVGATALPDDLDRVLSDLDVATDLAVRSRRLALQGHDVLHRWLEIARTVEVGEFAGVARRREALERCAARVASDLGDDLRPGDR